MRAMSHHGIVAGGSARASSLGYPTANIPLTEGGISGVYAALVSFEGTDYPAVAFADPVRKVLEAHLFDVSENLYGKEITVELLKKLRDTKVFSDDEALKRAMEEDARNARAHFA